MHAIFPLVLAFVAMWSTAMARDVGTIPPANATRDDFAKRILEKVQRGDREGAAEELNAFRQWQQQTQSAPQGGLLAQPAPAPRGSNNPLDPLNRPPLVLPPEAR